MTAPHWFFRFMYDRESAAWERRRYEPEHRELVKRIADELANVVAPPGPVADLGCGPGAHALALARRGYDVVGVDGSPRMAEVARTRAARDKVDATFDVQTSARRSPSRTRRWEVSSRSSSYSTSRIPRPSSPRSGAASGRAGTC
jgi:SAM-dependent methyltransferase